ncbi:hypothetical protein VP01_315g8 [Puccinia sorghi]|uniref:VHS domain-containing protein n=1 Tax=Puccinia sorghi TaxID=27349 RepID=A0A0L6UYU4_9BASI|nr:hypothetical protein VP01_315g8 [Puccinia sorghi]
MENFFSKLTQSNHSLIHQTLLNHCQQQQQDPEALLLLTQQLSRSEPLSKDAVKALKKLIKQHSTQLNAIRLTVILLLYSSDRFKLLALKKLLPLLQETYSKSSSSNQHATKDTILKALAVLAYQFQHDQDLCAFTNYYNKIRPSHAPINGTPVAESEYGLFASPPHLTQQQQQQQQQPSQDVARGTTIPVMRDVQAEANVAKSNARLLIEALAFTSPTEMESNPIIQEFHAKCLQNQNQLMDDIPWATEQAARVRTYHQQTQQQQQAAPTHTQEPSLNEEVNSREEQLLSLLLSANSELVDAFRQYDELERLARNERELRLVEERSRRETSRFSSHAAPTGFLDPHALHYQHAPHASGSSSNASSRPSLDHSDHHGQSPPLSAPLGQQQQQQFNTIMHEDSHSSADHDHYPRVQHSPHQTSTFSHQPPDHNDIHYPNPEPSQKALGKMRRFSSARSLSLGPIGSDPLSLDLHPSSLSSNPQNS